jgi:hypothetical protein
VRYCAVSAAASNSASRFRERSKLTPQQALGTLLHYTSSRVRGHGNLTPQ